VPRSPTGGDRSERGEGSERYDRNTPSTMIKRDMRETTTYKGALFIDRQLENLLFNHMIMFILGIGRNVLSVKTRKPIV
jgi:hypothetical protein